MRQADRKQVLEALRQIQPAPIKEIARRSGWSESATRDALRDLAQSGLVVRNRTGLPVMWTVGGPVQRTTVMIQPGKTRAAIRSLAVHCGGVGALADAAGMQRMSADTAAVRRLCKIAAEAGFVLAFVPSEQIRGA